MYERCLEEAERLLASDKDVIVAVKKLWTDTSAAGSKLGFEVPTFPDFSAMLEGDPRFEFLPFHKTVTEDLEDPLPHDGSPDEMEMEQLGFFTGDRVKLRNVSLTPQLLGNIIRSKVDRTMSALTKAWDLRPEGDRETEDKLLEILSRTQKLQKEVKKTFSEERMVRLEQSLSRSGQTRTRRKASRRKKTVRKPLARKKAAMRKHKPAKRTTKTRRT